LVGVLPGLGPAGAIALLLPLALHAPPLAYLIMLFGITYGAQYGGSTTSILVNIPGEASSVITCLDGYAMARQGRAGPALGIAAFGSFIGGTVALLGVAFLAPALAELGLRFGRRSMPRCCCSFDRPRLSGARPDGQSAADGALRQSSRQRRPRSRHRPTALHVRYFGAARRRWLDSGRDRSL